MRESQPAPEIPVVRGEEAVDIESLPAGTILSDPVFGTGGSGPIQIVGINPTLPGQNAAVVFDSANPTGGDFDLGTPNQDFGGPGQGVGGESGSPFANMVALGKLIIVDVSLTDSGGDGLVDDPNDADVVGAAIDFDFAALGTVTATQIAIVDVEVIEESAFVEMFGPGDVLLNTVVLPQVGDNGVATVSLGPTAGVEHMRVTLNGSAAIDNIFFIPPTPGLGSIGDFVWCDENNDGVQDMGEPGLEGVSIRLYDCKANLLATTQTDANGLYLFSDLEAGCYEVVVDPTSAPEACSVPGDHCPTEITVDLKEGQNFLDADFCFHPAPPGLGSIGDFVWCDENNDGVQDMGEPGLEGVSIRLYECKANLLDETVTDSNGFYLFSDLEAGCYEVAVDPTSAPEACSVPGDHCPTEITVDLKEGQNFLDADFCFGPEPEGGEGCTPGYWKNHLDSWVDYSPDQTVVSVFANASLFPSIASATLLEALSFDGGPGSLGAARLLVHHSVAALLNAAAPGVDYPRTTADIVSDVDAALFTQNRGIMLELKSELDADNNLGCPLN